MCSGMPFVRCVDRLDDVAWRRQLATEDQRDGDGGLLLRQRRRRASSAWRWLRSLDRHSRWIVPAGNSSAR